MHAALVHSYDQPPRYGTAPDPVAGPGQVVLEVLACALHPLVRSRASGKHYSSAGAALPLVPGVDGVGRLPDGSAVFFTAFGAGGGMAERVAVHPVDCVPLPAGADPALIASAVNPAMSGWLALRARAGLRAGERVLVLGATGAAGRAAVQLAHHLGAGVVIGAGRNPAQLAELSGLGADLTVSLDPAPGGPAPDPVAAQLVKQAADVDVVVDYLWGNQAERAMRAIVSARPDPAEPLRWVQVGSMAGVDLTVPGAWLRSTALQLLGSGIGSVSGQRIIAELTDLIAALTHLPPTTRPVTVPLSAVEQAWTEPTAAGYRTVFVPS